MKRECSKWSNIWVIDSISTEIVLIIHITNLLKRKWTDTFEAYLKEMLSHDSVCQSPEEFILNSIVYKLRSLRDTIVDFEHESIVFRRSEREILKLIIALITRFFVCDLLLPADRLLLYTHTN